MEEIRVTEHQTSDHTQEAPHIASRNASVAGRGGGGEVIDGIAFQTNILALNAAFVAASVEKVDSGTGIVREAGSAISDIVKSADHINELLGQIATGSDQQSQGIGQVGSAVQELDRATQQNAAMVEQTAAAASALRDQAQGLATEVARFRLPQAA